MMIYYKCLDYATRRLMCLGWVVVLAFAVSPCALAHTSLEAYVRENVFISVGAANIDISDVEVMIRRIRAKTSIPVGVGFGIRDGETARRVGRIADAVVIGSRIVQEIADAPVESAAERAGRLVAEFRKAMNT